MRCERGALEVREDAGDGVAAAGLDGLGQRALGADEDGAGDEELGHVDVERRLRGAERRGRQVDQHRPVVDDEHVARVEPAVRDACRVQPLDLPPQILEQSSSLTWSALASSSGSMSGWRVTTSASPSGPSAAMTTSGTRTPACAAMKSRQRLVLDLLEAPDRRASRRIAVGEQPPAPGEPLRVLRVAAEHAYLQRAPAASWPTYSA